MSIELISKDYTSKFVTGPVVKNITSKDGSISVSVEEQNVDLSGLKNVKDYVQWGTPQGIEVTTTGGGAGADKNGLIISSVYGPDITIGYAYTDYAPYYTGNLIAFDSNAITIKSSDLLLCASNAIDLRVNDINVYLNRDKLKKLNDILSSTLFSTGPAF